MCNTQSQKAPKHKSPQVKQSISFYVIAQIDIEAAAISGGGVNQEQFVQNLNIKKEDDKIKVPQLTIWGAIITLGFFTTLVAFYSKFMVNSISNITASGTISTIFIGLILLPIIENITKHTTAVTVACKDKMSLAIHIAIRSSIQITLLVLPFVIILN